TGRPRVTVDVDLHDVEIEVLVALVARGEVEVADAQSDVGQQPGFQVGKVLPARCRPCHVQPERLDAVLVDRPHDALVVGVGHGGHVEPLDFRRVHGIHPAPGGPTLSVAAPTLDTWHSQPNDPFSHTRNTARSQTSRARAASSRWSASISRPATNPRRSTSWSAG